jgi:alpha-tubulin suppressor-like RCC1 family protein
LLLLPYEVEAKIMKIRRTLVQMWLLCAAMLQATTGGAQPVTQIAGGAYHSLFLKSDGSLWAMGWNQFGDLGDGTFTRGTNRPEQIVASNVTAIAAGWDHSLFLKSNGSLWAMGNNQGGQLGDGSYSTNVPYGINQPEQIVASNVTAIAAGTDYSLFLKSDGSLWAMGDNQNGQLGDGTYTRVSPYGTNQPEQIVASNVTAIATGASHSLFLKSDGSLWAMGQNYYGQLGDGTSGNPSLGIFISTNRPEQIVVSNVTAIAAGDGHSLFLKSDGSLWAMGWNQFGELGNCTYNQTNLPEQILASNVTAIAAGSHHSLFLKSNGSLWAMGDGEEGQLGDGSYSTNGFYGNGTNQPEQIVACGVTAIAAGEGYSLFLKSDGSLWAMGFNGDGELGDGTYIWTNRPEQIVVNASYNKIFCRLLCGTNMQLSFVGVANENYALDRSTSLSPPNWIPQATNPAGSVGALVFTNPPDATPNNFWRIRSVP